MVGGVSWGYVGLSWGYVAPAWGQCGPILGLCWPILGLSWPILGLCWPILGLCWPILAPCWPILRPMLAHLAAYVGPCWPILSHKIRKVAKSGKSTKHRKTRGFLATPGGRRLGRRPLSPAERRETPYGKDTARGPPPLPPTPEKLHKTFVHGDSGYTLLLQTSTQVREPSRGSRGNVKMLRKMENG